MTTISEGTLACTSIAYPNVSMTSKLAEAQDKCIRLANQFKILSDETRVRIIFCLNEETELNVRSLCERIGQSQPAVSHHLSKLREGGIIEMRREGKNNFYRLVPDGMESFQMTLNEFAQTR